MNKIITCLAFTFALISSTYAPTALFNVTAQNNAQGSVLDGRTSLVRYTITNKSKRRLENNGVVNLPNGITQVTQGNNICAQRFSLENEESCTLELLVNSELMGTQIHGGPRVCHTPENQVFCSDPLTLADVLDIEKNSTYQRYVFIALREIDEVISCTVTENNDLTNCSTVLQGHTVGGNNYFAELTRPDQVTLNNDATKLYISNPDTNDRIIYSTSDSDGDLTNYQSFSTSGDPTGIRINKLGNQLYFADYSNSEIESCDLDLNGNISGCASIAANVTNPASLALNHTNTKLYTASYQGGQATISYCTIDQTTYKGTACNTMLENNNTFSNVEALAISNNDDYLYAANKTNDTVTICQISADGTALTGCTSAYVNGDVNFNQPHAIALNQNNTIAYIGNYGSAGNNNHVVRCSVRSIDHKLTDCVNATDTATERQSGLVIY